MADHPGSHSKSARRKSKPTQGARDKPKFQSINKLKASPGGKSKFITKGKGGPGKTTNSGKRGRPSRK